MAIQLIGPSGATQEVDLAFQAARVSIRPVDVINWLAYGAASGALTVVAANGPVFSLRNTGANLLMVRRVQVGFVTTTAFTAAQGLVYQMVKANGFTASDSGGTALYVAGQNKHRLSFTNITAAPDIRISSTAALTAGTRTLETVSMGNAGGTSNGVGTSMLKTALLSHDTGDHPVILAQNEGFVITNLIAMGAAGVIQLHVNIELAEMASY
jgi:hypothetical protein